MGGGGLRGDLWEDHGRYFGDEEVTWEVIENKVSDVKFSDDFDLARPYSQRSRRDPFYIEELSKDRISTVIQALRFARHKLNKTTFRRLLADRDIRTELPSTEVELGFDGQEATNIIRQFLLTSN